MPQPACGGRRCVTFRRSGHSSWAWRPHLLGIGAQARSTGAMLSWQAIEIAVLACLTLFDRHLPEASIVPIIAFTAALQHTSFDALGPWTFNSAMTTGNIRNMATGFVLWMRGRNVAANRGKAIVAG